jgi:hypothetical protein
VRYQKSGEEEVDLKTEFLVTQDKDGPVIVLELWGGSTCGEYFTLSLEEADRLLKRLFDRTFDLRFHSVVKKEV